MRYVLLASLALSGFGCATVSEPEGVRVVQRPQPVIYVPRAPASTPIDRSYYYTNIGDNKIRDLEHPGAK